MAFAPQFHTTTDNGLSHTVPKCRSTLYEQKRPFHGGFVEQPRSQTHQGSKSNIVIQFQPPYDPNSTPKSSPTQLAMENSIGAVDFIAHRTATTLVDRPVKANAVILTVGPRSHGANMAVSHPHCRGLTSTRVSKSRSDGSKAGQKRMQAGPQDIVRLQTSGPCSRLQHYIYRPRPTLKDS